MLGALVVLAAVALALAWWNDPRALLEWKRQLEPGAFFTVLAVGGALGLPTTPFYVAAGALFGPAAALAGVAAAVPAMYALTFALARSVLRPWSAQCRRIAGTRLDRWMLRTPAARVLVVRLLPLLPSVVKSYACTAIGAPFGVYMVVSSVVGVGYAAAMVLLGDAALTGNLGEALLATGIVVSLGVLGWWSRRRVARERLG